MPTMLTVTVTSPPPDGTEPGVIVLVAWMPDSCAVACMSPINPRAAAIPAINAIFKALFIAILYSVGVIVLTTGRGGINVRPAVALEGIVSPIVVIVA